ncbi:MAG: hypothetical protein FWF80_04580, partial [Defluviitaleaceae bacterium]|nr:hypothetical protein [Defluviitaleaceae bacterium]
MAFDAGISYAQNFEAEHIDEESQFSYALERSEARIEIDELGIEVADASNPLFQRIVNESSFHAFDMRSPSLSVPLGIVPETDSFASEATDISAFNENVSIPDSSLGRWLQGRISTQTVWHSFNAPANRRITVGLEYSRGIYDLHLFRRVGNNLVPVAVSWVGNIHLWLARFLRGILFARLRTRRGLFLQRKTAFD